MLFVIQLKRVRSLVDGGSLEYDFMTQLKPLEGAFNVAVSFIFDCLSLLHCCMIIENLRNLTVQMVIVGKVSTICCCERSMCYFKVVILY